VKLRQTRYRWWLLIACLAAVAIAVMARLASLARGVVV
jgi:hypothetical protein